jgi:hypothetical protein
LGGYRTGPFQVWMVGALSGTNTADIIRHKYIYRHVRHVHQAQGSGRSCGIVGGYGSRDLFWDVLLTSAQHSAASPTFLKVKNVTNVTALRGDPSPSATEILQTPTRHGGQASWSVHNQQQSLSSPPEEDVPGSRIRQRAESAAGAGASRAERTGGHRCSPTSKRSARGSG